MGWYNEGSAKVHPMHMYRLRVHFSNMFSTKCHGGCTPGKNLVLNDHGKIFKVQIASNEQKNDLFKSYPSISKEN